MISTFRESAERASELFRTFKSGKPELIPTGILGIDEQVGGLGHGTTMIIGAGTGIGKSSVAIDACLTNQEQGVKTAYFTFEDGHDVLGCRMLARYSGVDSRKVRKKSFNVEEKKRLEKGYERLVEASESETAMVTVMAIGKSLEWTIEQIEKVADLGCKLVVFDYIQKVRGISDDRRTEVGTFLYRTHAALDRHGLAGMYLSQVSRQIDKLRIPSRHALKESGDLENEARVILMLGRLEQEKPNQLWGRLDKSTFGGEGEMMKWERRECGTLFQVKEFTDE